MKQYHKNLNNPYNKFKYFYIYGWGWWWARVTSLAGLRVQCLRSTNPSGFIMTYLAHVANGLSRVSRGGSLAKTVSQVWKVLRHLHCQKKKKEEDKYDL